VVSVHDDDVLVAGISVVDLLAMVRWYEIVAASGYKEGWDVTSRGNTY
jgi:hypothetical protein